LASCNKPDKKENPVFTGKVIIIGAGAAGLYAGYTLQQNGVDFEILEANTMYGGRLGKLTGFANYPIDLGAQWLHGNKNLVGDLIKKTKTPITKDDSEITYWFRDKLVTALPRDIDIFSRGSLPDISFKDYAIQKGFGEAYAYIVEALAGDQGASADKLSVYYNNLEEKNWSSGEGDYKFEHTYFDLLDVHIATPIKDKIRLNHPVTKIDYTDSTIKVTTQNNKQFIADKVLITVPITILQKSEIEFYPPLPIEKRNAFSKIGMGAGMKVFLRFDKTFYHDFFIGGTTCAAYANDMIGKSKKDNVLLAFVMGKQAEALTLLENNEAITKALLTELDIMYKGQATASFLSSHVQNYTTHPYIKGAYSYSTIGIGNARFLAATPVDKKLYFAGEAMHTNGHHQTVQGAMETGYRQALDLLKNL
jgi:lysine-specific histone demethylase 1B